MSLAAQALWPEPNEPCELERLRLALDRWRSQLRRRVGPSLDYSELLTRHGAVLRAALDNVKI